MALQGGHRFSVSMTEAFPHGLFAMSVEQAQDYNGQDKPRTPTLDKQTGSLVWTISCIDRDPEARVKEVKVKLLAPYMPVLPPEAVEGVGVRPIEFTGLTVTPYVEDGRGNGRARLALSFRATGFVQPGQGHGPGQGPGQEAGKAPAGSATQTGRSGGQAHAA